MRTDRWCEPTTPALDAGRHEDGHGGIDRLELESLGIDPRSVRDMSTNVAVVTHPESVRQALRTSPIASYPDRHCLDLRRAIARRLHVDADRILAGNGCSELIHLVATAAIRPGDTALVIGPTFSEYRRAVEMHGGAVLEIAATADTGFVPPLDAVRAALRQEAVGSVWLCNPNNPTGRSIPAAEIRGWVEEHPDVAFVVDESYADFVARPDSLVHEEHDNLIVLRSMTKSYAIAGVRLGYAVAAPGRLSALARSRIPWSVSGPAQAVGVAVLAAHDHYAAAWEAMRRSTQTLTAALRERGHAPVASDTCFWVTPVADAASFRAHLLRHGILVRDCTSFGLPGHVRIAIGDERTNAALLSAIDVAAPSTPGWRGASAALPCGWDDAFRDGLARLFRLRRDVRRFRTDPLPAAALERLVQASCLAPSVGYSQPWRFVRVTDPDRRRLVITEFESQNRIAAAGYDAATAAHYRRLRLAGLREAPEQIAVFVDPDPARGRGLGRTTMPESVAYSAICAIQNLWLAARSEGIGIGWVSILDPAKVRSILEVPERWELLAYLCVGYPQDDDVVTPELETRGWEARAAIDEQWIIR